MTETLRDAGPYLAQNVNAGNDVNGNPRRGWIIYALAGDYAHVVAFVKEDQSLRRFRAKFGATAEAGIVLPITVREYRRMVKEWAVGI